MHRWTARTWQGMHCLPEDVEFLTIDMPRASLKNSYLMNGLLAAAAADLANFPGNEDRGTYIRAALEYGNKASAEFRAELPNLNGDNILLLYHFAMLSTLYHFALPMENHSAMSRITAIFHLVLGATAIVAPNLKLVFQASDYFRAMAYKRPASLDCMEPGSKVAIDHLYTLSEHIRAPSKHDDAAALTSSNIPPCSESLFYRIAIAQLAQSFAEELGGSMKCYFLTVIPVGGPKLVKAMELGEPMAWYIVMYLGVILHRLKGDKMLWWGLSTGQSLVREVSEFLLATHTYVLPGASEAIKWARQAAGLPDLTLPSALRLALAPDDLSSGISP
jgi:hypothetical protein